MQCELVSWQAFYNLGRRLAGLIRESGFKPDLIVAIARGGYLPARIISDHLGVMNLADFRIEHYQGTRKSSRADIRYPLPERIKAERVLLVDDVADSGDTFEVAFEHVNQKIEPTELKTAVLHYKTASSCRPDYFADKVEKWRWIIYPWAVMEDLTGFIEKIEPAPAGEQEVVDRLRADYGLEISRETAGDVLASLNYQTEMGS